MGAWLTARLAGWGTKIAVAGAFIGLVLLGCLRLIGIGKKAEKADRAQADQVVRARVHAVRPPEVGETQKSLQEGIF